MKPSRCVYVDATHHSDDIIRHYSGSTTPTLICGYHQEARGLPSNYNRKKASS